MGLILQSYAEAATLFYAGNGVAVVGVESYAVVTPIFAVGRTLHYDRLFALAFSPFLVLILITVGLRWYRAQKSRSQ